MQHPIVPLVRHQASRRSGPAAFLRRLLKRAARLVRARGGPPVGRARFGSLRRVTPISLRWGFDRGLPVDRYYIERFLARESAAIRGRVLEVAGNDYTRRFGGERIASSDVLHVAPGHSGVTIVADLTCAPAIPSDCFDSIICTQTLQVIYDPAAAVRTLYRILKPGGVALVTGSGICRISPYDMERWGEYWRFTTLSMQRLFESVFAAGDVRVESYGNVLSATAFLYGLAAGELRPSELDYHDPEYQVTIAVRAAKPEA